ncbi:hypothetical protein A1O1_03491 [Capronia coronata CBS 617.96]|uniref:Zn(2)-C6 fungal-type domain-containing protein n=1 Tax=Capronia coronata CBS 617.96 TaxID=1182541 RepID=W9YL62_9EURO|nr:uncharacterized protein A1O1_03491 [Capronia coronata CBS 617.96]EXJ90390.1 hypothetical protein A1O1_03491 [Capronia coronata CBS 617.96]
MRPHCRRCIESGRKCEGPVAHEIRFMHDQAVVSHAKSKTTTPGLHRDVSLVAPQHNNEERRAFYFFLNRAAPVFAGGLNARFWLDLIPRLAQSSPFIWDAVVSISWLFERVPYDILVRRFETQPTCIVSSDHRKAVKWYGRAIAGLRRHMERGEIDTPVALLSCILFISVESQQRNIGNALSLVETAYKLLCQSLSTSVSRLSADSLSIHEVVTPFVSRHAVLMATLGTPLPPDWSCQVEENVLKPAVLASLSELDESRARLYSLTYQAYEIIRVENIQPTEDRIVKMQRVKQTLLLQDLRQWESSFVRTWRHETRNEMLWAVSNLLMHWVVCYIWLSTCTSQLQTTFDDYRDQFSTILDHAEKVLKYSIGSTTGQPIFRFEIGLIPPLYFCAIKCRDPMLRRRALAMMMQAPEKESLWSSVATETMIENVIAMEEGKPYDASQSDLTGPLPLPPEENRIHNVAVVGKDVLGGTQRFALELSKYVTGPDGVRRMVSETVWLEEAAAEQT